MISLDTKRHTILSPNHINLYTNQQKTASIVTVGEHKFSQLPFDVLNGDVGYINTDAINGLVKELSRLQVQYCAASFKYGILLV